jgi:hypothetical protein
MHIKKPVCYSESDHKSTEFGPPPHLHQNAADNDKWDTFLIKGIVSRDLHLCFWYHSIDLRFLHLIEPFVCFLIVVSAPRRKNLKIRHENDILKANEPAPYVSELQRYRMTPNNIPQNLVRLSL